MDMTESLDKNISFKEYNKTSKYKDFEIEIIDRWHLKTPVIPIIIGALSLIEKSTDKHINS